ncbi:MAG: DUF805 domain-containing protein [Capnocytophaga felis]|nr:DUF805 domain-containing protein [Capnocytophaga felis]
MIYWWKQCFKRYTDFKGRSRRSEFWYFYLINSFIYLLIIGAAFLSEDLAVLAMILLLLYYLVAIVPNIAVAVRRLHDTGRSGWNIFWGLIPYIGGLILLYFWVQDSQPNENKWGVNPKGIN